MIGLIGINHKTASVEYRERFAFTNEEAIEIVNRLKEDELVEGAVVLSTCNRSEIYYHTKLKISSHSMQIMEAICLYKGLEVKDYSSFIMLVDRHAIRHLFKLASGLESLVIGETQILGQVKEAYRLSIDNEQNAPTLSRVFHKAFETAKRIRSEYFVTATPSSAGAEAVNLLHKKSDAHIHKHALIVGAGQMAEVIYEQLNLLGYSNISIYNRTYERASRFSQKHGEILFYSNDQLKMALQNAQLVFVATSSITPIITASEVSSSDSIKFFFDLAVPRNIAPQVDQLPLAKVYTIDDLRQSSSSYTDNIDLQKVDSSIEEMVEEMMQWLEASKIRKVIATIQHASDLILEKELKRLPTTLTPQELAIAQKYEAHLRTCYSRAIIRSLKEITANDKRIKYAEAIGALFINIKENIK